MEGKHEIIVKKMEPVKETSENYRNLSSHASRLNGRNKAVCMVTSTPLKINREQQSKPEWPFSVEESPNLSLDHRSLMKCTANSASLCKNIKEGNNLRRTLVTAQTGSTDETCLVNQTREVNSDKNSPPNKVDFDPRNEVKKRKVKNSDEENEYQNHIKNSVKKSKYIKNRIAASSTDVRCSTQKTNPQKVNDSINSKESLPIYKATVDNELDATGEIFSNSIGKPCSSNDVLVFKKPLDNIEVLRRKSVKQKVKQSINNDETPTVRKSSRKRYKPLEYWNGERLIIRRDDSPELVMIGDYINAKEKKSRILPVVQTELKDIQQSNEVSSSTPSTGIAHKAETEIISEPLIEEGNERRLILKSKARRTSRKQPRFPGTTAKTTGRPVLEENSESAWHVNFRGKVKASTALLKFHNFSILPGLNTVMGIVSSSIVQMRPNGINRSQAPEHHHMVFCIMVGDVTVTIHETSIKMNTYGHFTVPCGVSYTLENTGKKKAILSCFEIANSD